MGVCVGWRRPSPIKSWSMARDLERVRSGRVSDPVMMLVIRSRMVRRRVLPDRG